MRWHGPLDSDGLVGVFSEGHALGDMGPDGVFKWVRSCDGVMSAQRNFLCSRQQVAEVGVDLGNDLFCTCLITWACRARWEVGSIKVSSGMGGILFVLRHDKDQMAIASEVRSDAFGVGEEILG
ncbi:hypothetical protein IV203_032726 [Nitzschia inconspicua]|uniref:Uncharacterized protein n=1 Tax=Nitzschia inconspicua TaxID=303405 RepID=A0A9K3KLE3_9STRA|nr:hypothetical protein IV203_032726 [Nitzschia inconspicua]